MGRELVCWEWGRTRKGCVGTRRYSGGVRGETAELRFSCEQTKTAERAAELRSWVSVHCGGR